MNESGERQTPVPSVNAAGRDDAFGGEVGPGQEPLAVPGAMASSAAPLPAWVGPVLWAAAVVAIVGGLLLRPITLGAGQNAGDTESLPAVLRAFDLALAVTGWGVGVRTVVTVASVVALAAAIALMWLAFSSDER